jgi:hypothetical protein
MAVSDARRLQVYEQARAHWGEGPAEALMELVVPAGQDMATKADIDAAVSVLTARMDGLAGRMDGLAGRMDGLDGRMDGLAGRIDGLDGRMDGLDGRMDGLATKEYVLRMLLITQIPIYFGILSLLASVVGLYFTG